MPGFPLIESEINALAMTMKAGYTSDPADFPHVDLAGLTAAYDAYRAAVSPTKEILLEDEPRGMHL